ncbi:hypothetical protein [Sorangium sp. So ce363]|uniref:hypothetical protein n=1 Tax=Sorangium sp. So ce363 TaxID=3133304 RepID=UPI003F5F4F53
MAAMEKHMKTNLKIESLRRGPRSVLALLVVAAAPACAAAPAEEPMVEDPAGESVDASEEALRSGDAAGGPERSSPGRLPESGRNRSQQLREPAASTSRTPRSPSVGRRRNTAGGMLRACFLRA